MNTVFRNLPSRLIASIATAIPIASALASPAASVIPVAVTPGSSVAPMPIEVTRLIAPSPAHWLDAVFWGNSVWMWITAFATLAIVFVIAMSLQRVFVSRLRKAAERTTTRVDDLMVDVLASIRPTLVLLGSLVVATRVLNLDPRVNNVLQLVAVVAVCIQLLMSSSRLIDFGLNALAARSTGKDGRTDETVASSMGVLRFLSMLGVAILVVLLALDNLGVAVTPLLAGLGIGGIAIALAVQNILGDLFASVSILIDKPFVVGDFIVIGEKNGTVERIGVKTTRIRTLSGEELIVSNNDLLSSRIHNFRRMIERRIEFNIGVTYETPPALLRQISEIVKAAIESQGCRFSRCALMKLNTYSLDFNIVYFITSREYDIYVAAQQEINLTVITEFARLGINFAYPTQLEYTAPAPDTQPPNAGPSNDASQRA